MTQSCEVSVPVSEAGAPSPALSAASSGEAGAPAASTGVDNGNSVAGANAGLAGKDAGPPEGDEAGPADAPSSLDAAPPLPPSALVIVRADADPTSFCTGAALDLHFRVEGGLPPYTWTLESAPTGISNAARTGTEFELTGTPTLSGSIALQVSDDANQIASYRTDVAETPRITLTALPSVCPDELYSVPLRAEPGDPTTYDWSARLVSDATTAARLDDLGLQIDAATLDGHFIAPRDSAPMAIALQAHAAGCASAEVQLPLDVLPTGTELCPHLRVDQRAFLPDATLPSPCIGSDYREALVLDAGGLGATARQVTAPPGLQFDPATGLVTGKAEAEGDLVLRVASDHHDIEQHFSVRPRQRCWFGAIDETSAPASLDLIDVRRLGFRPTGFDTPEAHRTFPGFPTDAAVVDFRFSPDTRRIAYRLNGTDQSGLWVVDLLAGREQLLYENVQSYAWSDSGEWLAAISTENGGTRLLATNGFGADSAPDAGANAISAAVDTDISVGPVWFGADGIAFLGDETHIPGLLTPGYLQTSSGASVLWGDDPYASGARLRGGPDGFFVFDPYTRFQAAGRQRVDHGDVVISPSGRYVAQATEGLLQVFPDYRSAVDEPTQGINADGCGRLLAWAKGRERIACYSDASAAIVLFDVVETPGAAPRLASAGSIAGAYAFPDAATSRRRVFSESGAWFAFATLGGVYFASLDASAVSAAAPSFTAARVGGITLDANDTPPDLGFSPDEHFLWVQQDAALSVLDLRAGRLTMFSTGLQAPLPCSDLTTDPAGGWCGAPGINPQVAWSADSDVLQTSMAGGTLQLYDASQAREPGDGSQSPGPWSDPVSVDPTCQASCADATAHAFQP